MLDIKNIQINSLPSVLHQEKSNLPRTRGIYFVVDEEEQIRYIGQSMNIRSRWLGHHLNPVIEKMGGAKIVYLLVSDESMLLPIESALIRHFNPDLNKNKGISPEEYADTRKRQNIDITDFVDFIDHLMETRNLNRTEAIKLMLRKGMEAIKAKENQDLIG